MEIKIELPGNVKVSCPTAHSAITVLRCVSYRSEQDARDGAPRSAKNLNTLGWQTIGSGLDGRGDGWVDAADTDNTRDPDEYGVEDAEFEEGVIAAQQINRDEGDDEPDYRQANDAGGGFPHLDYEDPNDPNGEEEEEMEDDTRETGEQLGLFPKTTTRSRMSASLFEGREEEDSESEVTTNNIFQPIQNRLGDRAKAVFDFIQTRLTFTTKDVRKYAEEELRMAVNKKNKKKLKKALKVIARAGLIEKVRKGEWKKVS